ncbi:hypothetical protein F5Y14DRAFT_209070 [Nemania sp. NC0429]|nr:hypothetical protein F5Y14DRAFT_209070 [Nemania sp. NC0429]
MTPLGGGLFFVNPRLSSDKQTNHQQRFQQTKRKQHKAYINSQVHCQLTSAPSAKMTSNLPSDLPQDLRLVATAYATYLVTFFGRGPEHCDLSPAKFNAYTDKFLGNVAGRQPSAVIRLVASKFTDDWLLGNVGPIIKAQGITTKYESGKTLFYEYLRTRAMKVVEAREAIAGLKGLIDNFKLDGE